MELPRFKHLIKSERKLPGRKSRGMQIQGKLYGHARKSVSFKWQQNHVFKIEIKLAQDRLGHFNDFIIFIVVQAF